MKHIIAIFKERKNPDRTQAFIAAGEIAKSIAKRDNLYSSLLPMIEIIIATLSKVKKLGTRGYYLCWYASRINWRKATDSFG